MPWFARICGVFQTIQKHAWQERNLQNTANKSKLRTPLVGKIRVFTTNGFFGIFVFDWQTEIYKLNSNILYSVHPVSS